MWQRQLFQKRKSRTPRVFQTRVDPRVSPNIRYVCYYVYADEELKTGEEKQTAKRKGASWSKTLMWNDNPDITCETNG